MGKLMVAVVMVLSGCGAAPLPGAPVVGSSCTTEAPECATTSSISHCEAGRWVEYQCAGACSNAQTPRCALAKPVDGEACPASWEDGGACLSESSLAICKGGRWTAGQACPACRSSNGVIQCV